MSDEAFQREFAAAKERSVSHALLKAGRLVDELGVARARARLGAPLRRAHTRLFPYVDLEGTRLSELARRVGISKQAVGVLVDELVEMGALERRPDPEDGRARRVHFATGPRSVLDGLSVLAGIEADLERALGAPGMRQLQRQLTRALATLEALAEHSQSDGHS
ncbi:MAG: MarR family transcriptional regulator [Myxococcales bacterium]|nr:MarR family transcriptional regulator [Myxococcales bacterium]MDD9968505.1 MarR family transcriptional regulator [Myxococcales bacterium]